MGGAGLLPAEIFRRSGGCPKSLADDPLISLGVKDRKVAVRGRRWGGIRPRCLSLYTRGDAAEQQ